MQSDPSAIPKAARELVALVLIWLGTAGTIFIGVPALVPMLVTDEQGSFVTDGGGNVLSSGNDPKAAAAYGEYLRWAGGGMALITGGMLLQAFGPVQSIVHERHRCGSRRKDCT